MGLNIDWVTFDYTIPPLIVPTARALILGVVLYVVYLLLQRTSPRAYLRRVVSRTWLLLWIRLWLVCFIFTYAYLWLKVSVPLVRSSLWDRQLWNLDILLHGGISPSILLTSLLRGSVLLQWTETWYGWWLPTMMFGLGFFCAYPDSDTRRRFMLSSVLLWTIGPWVYLAIPALGPCYTNSQVWDEVRDEIPRANGTQHMLWENYQKILVGRTGPLKQFNPTRGIAAMPSLHVGGHWLLMLWIRRRARAFYLPALLGVGLTLVGSIATGWHYAVDGYVGILVGQIAYLVANAVEDSMASKTTGGMPGIGDRPQPY